MTPATGTAVLILAAFVLPGFVTLTIKERTYEVPSQASAFDRLLATLYYSALVYAGPAFVIAVGGWNVDELTDFIEGKDGLRGPVAVVIAVIVVIPLLVAYLGHRWSCGDLRHGTLAWIGFNPAHASPTAWDFMFGEEAEQCVIRARLTDGTVVSGYYGPSSHSGFGGSTPDLFLEQLWTANDDGTTLEAAAGNFGLWLRADEIVSLELYAYDDVQEERIDRRREDRHGRARTRG